MQSRDSILDLFSTFACLDGDRVRQWLPDARLRRNMQSCLKDPNAPDQSVAESAWSLYWYKLWQSQQAESSIPHSQQHLAAYLQEPCYWIAQKAAQRFSQLEFSLADYFQLISSETVRVLKAFNPQYGTGLKSYASIVLNSVIKDHLRQRRAIDICSDWLLLRKVSQKQITEALHHAGISPSETEQYLFAWICFKTISVPTVHPQSSSEKSIDSTTWSAIADLYNSKRNQQLSQTAPNLTPEQIETRLTKLVRWIRQYLYPAVDSLNRAKPGQEEGELQDDLADPVVSSLLESAIAEETRQERQEQRSQLCKILAIAIGNLDEASQKILQLFYQENLSQQELAARMEMSQPTVSRRLKKAEETLLTDLLQNLATQMNKSPDPSELKSISVALKEWLESYYRGKPV